MALFQCGPLDEARRLRYTQRMGEVDKIPAVWPKANRERLQLNVTVPARLAANVEQTAASLRRTKSSIVEEALERHFKQPVTI
jgi:hypothetical protein